MNRTAGRYYPFSHYLMFPAVMVYRPELLKKIIQMFFPDIEIGELKSEKTLAEYSATMLTQKASRFDTVSADDQKMMIGVECITYEDGSIEIRVVRYTANMITDSLKRSQKYDQSSRVYVAVISAAPVNEVNRALSRYVFTDVLNGYKQLKYSPEILILCYDTDETGLTDEQKSITQYLREGAVTEKSSSLIREIDDAVKAVNEDQYWRENMISAEIYHEHIREESRAEERRQGIQKAVAVLCKTGTDRNAAIRIVAEEYDISEEEVKKNLSAIH